jgi:hypothetical protein
MRIKQDRTTAVCESDLIQSKLFTLASGNSYATLTKYHLSLHMYVLLTGQITHNLLKYYLLDACLSCEAHHVFEDLSYEHHELLQSNCKYRTSVFQVV